MAPLARVPPGHSRPASRQGRPTTGRSLTPLSLQLQREDGEQFLSRLAVQLPPGLIQSIKGVTECPQVALETLALASHTGLMESASPACQPSSQIGSIVAGSGSGTHPLYDSGKVYLAGPYEGAPLSLETVVPALGGPYDLGNVAIRSAIFVNPADAQVKAVTDPIPQITEGVPLRLRSLLIDLDRSNLNRTPTNCAPKQIEATVTGNQDAVASPGAFYQVANCASLPFGPKLILHLSGGLHRLGHPAIHAMLSAGAGEANLHSISVTLPPKELLDNSHISGVCSKVDFAAESCPAGSLVGRVEVTTPLLDQPLQGFAYLRSSGRGLPDLALDLHGQIRIEAVARIDAVKGGLRTTFHAIPDVPIDTVALNLLGGAKGSHPKQ